MLRGRPILKVESILQLDIEIFYLALDAKLREIPALVPHPFILVIIEESLVLRVDSHMQACVL